MKRVVLAALIPLALAACQDVSEMRGQRKVANCGGMLQEPSDCTAQMERYCYDGYTVVHDYTQDKPPRASIEFRCNRPERLKSEWQK